MCQSRDGKEISKILERGVDKRVEANRALFEKLSTRAQRAKFSDDGVLLLERESCSVK
jgi:hypothetical protein